MNKKLSTTLFWMLLGGVFPLAGFAQGKPVTGNMDHAAMLQSKDPKLAANKRVVYDFWREVVEARHFERIADYTTEGYIQHNPNFTSGRQNLLDMFVKSGRKPVPIEPRLKTPLVAITAEGDIVTLAFVRDVPDPKDATKSYTTTSITLFRVENGKLAEHWDTALRD
ncbi:MAG: nuclear transport factor 2 family protein [Pseudomonadota bacterium]